MRRWREFERRLAKTRYALPAFEAALALAGCDSTRETADTGAVTESTATMDNGVLATPAATETVIATPGAIMTADDGTSTVPDGTSVDIDGRNIDARIGPG